MGFSGQEYWSRLPCPPPGDLPDPGIQPPSPALASRFFTAEPAGKPKCTYASYYYAYRKNYDYSIITRPYYMKMGFLSSSASKESACNAGDPSSIPSPEISPGKGTGYTLQYPWASLLAQTVGKIPWRRKWQPTPLFLPGYSPWTEEPGGLQSMGSQRVGHDWVMNTAQYIIWKQSKTRWVTHDYVWRNTVVWLVATKKTEAQATIHI